MNLNSTTYSIFLNKELQEAIDAELGEEEEMNIVNKMECLYRWWEQEEPLLDYIHNYNTDSELYYDSDSS